MSLRPSELVALASELDRELRGGVVQKVYAPTASRLFLEVRLPGRSALLLFCAEPKAARVAVVEARPPNPATPPGWQSVLRRELVGARLVDVEAFPSRRTLVAHLSKGDRGLALVLEVGNEPGLALATRASRLLALSAPFRQGFRVGSEWTPPAEAPAGDAPSRLAGDHVFLRLAHAVEALFGAVEARAVVDARKAPLLAKLKRLARTREKVKADLARTTQAPALRREGELLAQNVHRLVRGAKEVTVTEWLEDGAERSVTLTLDPKRTPKEEVEHRFHQYRRFVRGADLAQKRLDTLDAEVKAVEVALADVDATPAPAGAPAPRKARPEQARLPPYRVYRGHQGHPIWVGRGALHNDALTFQVARPFHAWLHARGVPGAHVVVPLEKSAELGSELLLDAAHLALHHSDAKGEPRGEVSSTLVKFVKKPKGGAPGAVTYTRERTLMLRLEPTRLARLLASEEGSGTS